MGARRWIEVVSLASYCLLPGLLAACSLTIDTNQVQCRSGEDCADRGFPEYECQDFLCVPRENAKEEDTRFLCQNREWASPDEDTLDYELTILRLVGGTPYEGLTFSACPNFDPECESPIADATSDAKGRFSLPLPIGFRGHLFAKPPPDDPGLFPLVAYVFPPPSRDTDLPRRSDLMIASKESVDGLAMLDGASVVDGTGHVIFTTFDCNSEPLRDVSVTTSVVGADTWSVYVGEGGRPDVSLSETGASGQGAILNLPPGYITVRGTHLEKGLIFEQAVAVRADVLTSVPIVPSPTQ